MARHRHHASCRSAKFLALLGIVAAALGACGKEPKERPPVVGNMGGGPSLPPPVGSDGEAGSQSTGGSTSTGAQPGQDGLLVGKVVAYLGDDFFFTGPFEGDATVAAESAQGQSWVSAKLTQGTFELEGARLGLRTFVAVEPERGADYLLTITDQDTRDGVADAPLVPREVIDEIYQTLLVPADPNQRLGQLVVRIRNAQGQGVPAVSVSSSGAEFVSYAESGSWSELLEVTSASGLAFLGNHSAAEFPGRLVDLEVLGEEIDPLRVTVPVATGAVTVVNVTVNPK